MPKEIETEQTIVFCHIFIIGDILIEGVPGPSSGYTYAVHLIFEKFSSDGVDRVRRYKRKGFPSKCLPAKIKRKSLSSAL